MRTFFHLCYILETAVVLLNIQHFVAQQSGTSSNSTLPDATTLSAGGPNVCRSRYRNYCCPGWTVKYGTGLCIVPVCWRHCGAGHCMKPNICYCENGFLGSSCPAVANSTTSTVHPNTSISDGKSAGGKTCAFGCLNGGICNTSAGKCTCKPGYTGDYCSEPICKESCLNGGRCIGPDHCACVYGFAGKRCEADYRVGPCFRKVSNEMCQSQLDNVVCTKQLCCATIGKAWGHPCEHCPLQLDCLPGYLKNIHSAQCLDIDECEAIPGLCEGGGKCVNTLGAFECICPAGRRRDPATNGCTLDADECKIAAQDGKAICENGRCVNTDGGYYCICDAGYIPAHDQRHCLDARQDKCYVSVNSRFQCLDSIPAIKLSKMDCCCGRNIGKAWGENCEFCPIPGTDDYRALCMDVGVGGSGNGSTNGSVMSVNECVLRANVCGGGRCVDLVDGYRCECYDGYVTRKFTVGNGIMAEVCDDIDECSSSEGYCQGGQCLNTPGLFTCVCPLGFDLSSDRKHCIDHNECSENGMCANGDCINMDGSFKCHCHDGYTLSANGYACIDVDECRENAKICLNGRCVNLAGSYRCECIPGFQLTSVSGSGAVPTFCVDIDECQSNSSKICQNGKCINTEGSFRCICNPGYGMGADKSTCIDVNECVQKNICQNGGRCVNKPGYFECECADGFTLSPDGRSCLDTRKDLCYADYDNQKCGKPSSMVVSKSTCCCSENIVQKPKAWGLSCIPCPLSGSTEFDMLCPRGSGMTFNGQDINECAENPTICGEHGACENLVGSYRCVCHTGFQSDSTGKICTDIDECVGPVCVGGQCKNTVGSFQCLCPSGTSYNESSEGCVDIDECAVAGTCLDGLCRNTVGSFECQCPSGSVLDSTGRICLDNRKGSCWTRLSTSGQCENNLPVLTLKSECCCSVGLAWGSPCELCHAQDCSCPKGFAKIDGKVCSDVNECELNVNLCRGGGTCLNIEGSFTCICPPGFSLDSAGTVCQDKRSNICYLEYKFGTGISPIQGRLLSKSVCCCTNIGKAWATDNPANGTKTEPCPRPGSAEFTDLCPKGYGFVEKKDINECSEFGTSGICQNGRCKNYIGSFECNCNSGFSLDETGTKCIDIDECSIMHGVCGENGDCKNQVGSFECICKNGFEANPLMRLCMDINECERNGSLCTGGKCINDEGSFHCECAEGLELSQDRLSCKDIDECSIGRSGICSNGICENTMGSYQCICDNGFQQTNFKSHCEDINECDVNNGGCGHLCVNIPGSYNCDCEKGFELSDDGRVCVDVDECVVDDKICNGGQCVNTVGAHYCICSDGLLPLPPNNMSCTDVNECEQLNATNICGPGQCTNNFGGYECRCNEGYSVKSNLASSNQSVNDTRAPLCTDDDECVLQTHKCDANAFCFNTPGSYSCLCGDGFNGNGFICNDINECVTNNGGCNSNAHCINNDGSFKCVCDEGFTGDGFVCHDVDECVLGGNVCENGQCINYAGGFRCECDMGFVNPSDDKSQQSCIDINECEMFDNLCVFGRCENVIGMFRCECNHGYQIDGTGGNCTDINECDSPESCLYGNCTNTEGGYVCKCPPNYQLTAAGNACVDRRELRCYTIVEETGGRRRCSQELGSPVTKATCCCSIGKAWGGKCEPCPAVGSDSFKALCPAGVGYRPNVTTVVLEDINECEEHENLCKNGQCSNTFGSYMCICNDGFKFDNSTGTFCSDIDECAKNPDICGLGNYCINEEGSYHCVCMDGFVLLPSGKECVDTRKEQCYMNYTEGMCSEAMKGAQTRMICCCSMGQAWGRPCQQCPAASTNEWTQLCGVRPGQVKNPMTQAIEGIDECSLMPGMCKHGTCVNTATSFYCVCEPGYIYDETTHQCIDENECTKIKRVCKGISQCVNTVGSYHCECPDGYKLNLNMDDCVDKDECTDEDGEICKNGVCTNLAGSFECWCKSGFTLSANRTSCTDIDECLWQPNICGNGSCHNLDGSHQCYCFAGFMLSQNNDCIDVDECSLMPNLCRNGRCHNLIGSYECQCADGFTSSSDGHYCIDVDECQKLEGGGGELCQTPGRCQNTIGSYLCICPPGYRLNDNKTQCLDVDECMEHAGSVCIGGTCVNENGGMLCECPEGFIVSDSGSQCVDQRHFQCYRHYNEGICSDIRNDNLTMKECCCSMAAAWGPSCTPCPVLHSAEWEKLCPMGAGRGGEGEDLNECELLANVCGIGGECVNTDGSYRCDCSTGYVLDANGTCVDENECNRKPNVCGNGTCTNIIGNFECSCAQGFTPGATTSCEDINECLDWTLNGCAFRCHNTMGSYRCLCPYGYSLASDGKHCQDIDECSTIGGNNCKFKCKNLIGSYKCICPDGYQQNNTVASDGCQDINECLLDAAICGPNGMCINLDGGYRCECEPGFAPSADNKRCLDDRLGYCFRHLENGACGSLLSNMTKVSHMDCCCTVGLAWASSAQPSQCELCPPQHSAQYLQLCSSGGFTADGRDIDECVTMPDLCQNGRCVNTPGAYRCLCNRGYKSDFTATKCIDINECAWKPSPCQMSCENIPGSYKCNCSRGFELGRDNSTCKDVDECTTGKHICQQRCTNTNGSYQCSCNPGYRQSDQHCLDVDECVIDGVCPAPGTCINTLGSYRCLCPRGYKLHPTGNYCVDSKFVAPPSSSSTHTDLCPIGEKCPTNTSVPASPNDSPCNKAWRTDGVCADCSDGFRPHPSQKGRCVDLNECEIQPPVCGDGARCLNKVGTYLCLCPDSFYFDDFSQSCFPTEDVNSGCTGCAFGCRIAGTDGSGISQSNTTYNNVNYGYLCACPFGYQTIGQGHCLATINGPWLAQSPGSSTGLVPNLGANIPTYLIPDGEEQNVSSNGFYYSQQPSNSKKIISTEGCFACKINEKNGHSVPIGRHRRETRNLMPVLRTLQTSRIYDSKKRHRKVRHVNEQLNELLELEVTISKSHLRAGTQILKLTSSFGPLIAGSIRWCSMSANMDEQLFKLVELSTNLWTLESKAELLHHLEEEIHTAEGASSTQIISVFHLAVLCDDSYNALHVSKFKLHIKLVILRV